MFRISELPEIPAINPATDKLAIVDDSETETCRVTVDELLDVRFDETLASWTLASSFSITSAATYNQPNNGVHPANAGYWQLADLLRSYLKAIET